MNHLLAKAAKLIADNSPTILTTIGVTGTVVTAFLTGKASIKAYKIVEFETAEHLIKDPDFEFDDKTKIKLVWKEFIPPVAVGTLTIACIIGANRIGSRRTAALAAAYSLTEKAFEEYKDKVQEHIGANREQRVRDDIAQDRVNANPVTSREVIVTGAGEVLCYDSITGRYFTSTVEKIRSAQNDINHDIIHDLYATLSEFYSKIGLPSTPYSTEMGWNADELLDIKFSTVLSDDGRPCISLDYVINPIRDYHRLR
jgi:hypothetical protein